MTRILHLSDLHFGFHRKELVGPLVQAVNRAGADLVIVTGDVTHRGRPGQYEDAAAFLAGIEPQVMVVPGNHDVPLYNIPIRFLTPWAHYRRAISPDLQPVRQVGDVRVIGLNSADPFTWQRGIVRQGEIGRIVSSMDPLAINIVALHHPMQHMPGVDKELIPRADEALQRMADAGVQVALSGHLHQWAATELLAMGHSRVLQVQGASALCARVTDIQNEFAVLDFQGDRLTIERHVSVMPEADFRTPVMTRLRRVAGEWQVLDQDDGAAVSVTPIAPGGTVTAFRTA